MHLAVVAIETGGLYDTIPVAITNLSVFWYRAILYCYYAMSVEVGVAVHPRLQKSDNEMSERFSLSSEKM